MVNIKKDKKAMGVKLAVVLVVMLVMVVMTAGLTSQEQQNVNLEIVVENGCPVAVNDLSDSCGPGQGGPGVACASPGATVLRWSSTSGDEFSINFYNESPLGSGKDYNSNPQGQLTAPVPPSAAAGEYDYGVTVGTCELDPKIIVKN